MSVLRAMLSTAAWPWHRASDLCTSILWISVMITSSLSTRMNDGRPSQASKWRYKRQRQLNDKYTIVFILLSTITCVYQPPWLATTLWNLLRRARMSVKWPLPSTLRSFASRNTSRTLSRSVVKISLSSDRSMPHDGVLWRLWVNIFLLVALNNSGAI